MTADPSPYVLECIVHKRDDDRETALPIRHMVGPFPSFEAAHGQLQALATRYETILTHRLQKPPDEHAIA